MRSPYPIPVCIRLVGRDPASTRVDRERPPNYRLEGVVAAPDIGRPPRLWPAKQVRGRRASAAPRSPWRVSRDS